MMHIDALKLWDIGPFKDATIRFPKGSNSGLADVYLLTGPNGVGKSTALYAIADCFNPDAENLKAIKRMCSPKAFYALRANDETVMVTRDVSPGNMMATKLRDPFLPETDAAILPCQAGSATFGRFLPADGFSRQYQTQVIAADFIPISSTEVRRFSWAAFAYAGQRAMTEVVLKSIEEPHENPLKNSLSFFQTTDTSMLLNWIVNQDFKRLRSKEDGRQVDAQRFASNIEIIEQAIRDITGTDFGFDLSGTDINVRIRWNGALTGIEVLPDGLKSILSWIADLLMRLDRIPWETDMSVLERPFLLLLDEIDIHLHPAWQRKVLPIVQKLFPNSQIIATTHSPFVVASVEDAYVISLKLDKIGHAVVDKCEPARLGVSYSAILRSIFGIDSEFDVATEELFNEFHTARSELLSDISVGRAKVDEIAEKLAERSEEVDALVRIELRQLERQLVGRNSK